MTDETDQRYLYRVVAALDALGSELARVRVRGRGRGRGYNLGGGEPEVD